MSDLPDFYTQISKTSGVAREDVKKVVYAAAYTQLELKHDILLARQTEALERIATVLEDAFGTSTREEARREFREVMSQIEMSVRR